jgi:hypothetical protein
MSLLRTKSLTGGPKVSSVLVLWVIPVFLAFACACTTPTPVPTPPQTQPPNSNPTPPSGSTRNSSQLPISGVFQQTAEWCWAAVGEMVLRYYNEPNLNPFGNYQCGEVGLAGNLGLLPSICQFDCSQCVVGIGNGQRFASFLQAYPNAARSVTGGQSARTLSVSHFTSALSFSQVTASIGASTPIIAGITPDNIPSPLGPAHATLIVGYDASVAGRQWLYVNDPYPYGLGPLGPYGDPYLRRGATYIAQGRYLIDYSTFAAGLFWTDTITVQ